MSTARILSFLITFAFADSLQAQIYKAFIDKKGSSVDSTLANSYILYKQLDDSLWIMQQYDLTDTLLFAATYKDPQLRIEHGQVYRYWKGKEQAEKGTTNYYLLTTGHYTNGKKSGIWTEYFSTGKPKSVTAFENGLENGAHEIYFNNGSPPSVVGNFVNGKADGEWLQYNMDGELYQTTWYKSGKQKKIKKHKGVLSDFEKGNSFDNINPASPPGGMNAFSNNLSRSLRYPSGISNHTTLLVKFTVKTDGSLADFKIERSVDPQFDHAVIEYLKRSPKWKPALSEGKPIEQNFMLPVRLKPANSVYDDMFNDQRLMSPLN